MTVGVATGFMLSGLADNNDCECKKLNLVWSGCRGVNCFCLRRFMHTAR